MIDDLEYPTDLLEYSGEYKQCFRDLLMFSPRVFEDAIEQKHMSKEPATPVRDSIVDRLLDLQAIALSRPQQQVVVVQEASQSSKASKKQRHQLNREMDTPAEDSKQQSATQKDAEQKDKEKEEENTVLTAALAVGASVMTLVSVYFLSKNMGQIEFQQQFKKCKHQCRQKLRDLEFWISERRQLHLAVEESILYKHQQFTALLDVLDRLEQPEKTRGGIVVSAGGLLSGALLIGAYFQRPMQHIMQKSAFGVICASALYFCYLQGKYASNVYSVSISILKREAKSIHSNL
ncbi:hypothetical protein EDD86DRAFT_212190 [Gorgonomyces haynaldii]|nr:hypothetical protein EDD86DRAFT_212190 [Gorgonomyces haynaldii]